MTPEEKQKLKDAIAKLIDMVDNHPEERTCTACLHFDAPNQQCLWHTAKVPPEWIEKGCDQWETMPF